MRIAMFSETFLPGTDGIVTRLCATLDYLAEAGHQVLLFAPAGAPKEYACATILQVPDFRFFLYPEKHFALPRLGFGKQIREFQPDLIHVVNPAFLGLTGVYYAWRYQLPLLASYHTNVPGYARHYHLNWLEPALWWYFRTLHNKADINLCTSRATLAELERHGFHDLGLWERGVDVQRFASAKRSEAMRARLTGASTKTGDKVLLYVGRLASEKGIERLRRAVQSVPDVHLAIVGDGPYRDELERVFAGTKTVFTGYMYGKELAEAYASADGFVFPSTTETLGLVLFEAMASGLPVMAADSPPTREVLENGNAGFIFNAMDTRSILDVMNALFYNQEKRAAVQKRSREIAANLDWKGPTNQLVSHYQHLFSGQMAIHSEAVRGSRL